MYLTDRYTLVALVVALDGVGTALIQNPNLTIRLPYCHLLEVSEFFILSEMRSKTRIHEKNYSIYVGRKKNFKN
jgi:hypothetical protein